MSECLACLVWMRLCKELLLLPFGLAETAGVRKVVECFSSYVDWLSEFPAPSKDDAAFTELLKQILKAGRSHRGASDRCDLHRTMQTSHGQWEGLCWRPDLALRASS